MKQCNIRSSVSTFTLFNVNSIANELYIEPVSCSPSASPTGFSSAFGSSDCLRGEKSSESAACPTFDSRPETSPPTAAAAFPTRPLASPRTSWRQQSKRQTLSPLGINDGAFDAFISAHCVPVLPNMQTHTCMENTSHTADIPPRPPPAPRSMPSVGLKSLYEKTDRCAIAAKNISKQSSMSWKPVEVTS